MPRISQLAAETTPANDDELAIVDTSGAVTKKITRGNLLSGTPLPANTVDTQAIADGAVTSEKLVEAFLRGRFQSDTTNTAPTGLTFQSGWGFVTGTGTNSATKTVTFPVAFTSVLGVIVGTLGTRSGSDPAAIGDLNTGLSGSVFMAHGFGISTTGFSARVTADTGITIGSTVRAGFSWIAIGVV